MNRAQVIRKALANFDLSPIGHTLATVLLANEGALNGGPATVPFTTLWEALHVRERVWEEGEAANFLVDSVQELVVAKAKLTRQNGEVFLYGLLEHFELKEEDMTLRYVLSSGIARDVDFWIRQVER